MTHITLSQAKDLAKECFKDLTPEFEKKFQEVHSYKVGKLAKMIANKLDMYDEVFEIAGWVHDIGYCRDHKNHAEYSVKILKEKGYEVDEILSDCILNHGNAKSPTTTEGRIFQLADKLSIFDEDILEVLVKNTDFPYEKEAVDFLKGMAEKTFRMLEKF